MDFFMPQNNHAFVFDDCENPKIINSAQLVCDLRSGEIIPCVISGIEVNNPYPGLSTYYLESDYIEDNDKFSSTFGNFFCMIIESMSDNTI